ncbi:hypothetical protein [Streptomyces lavendofoliae]|uniref:Uncharacterized protein n=1 Tax=Streptomyces lavendofoliae TaxID=67314 RepID=A0A918HXB4_9ACTN|nr:hypothetical protein [Streptomyces lavendofoliae]GGU32780.1 hypothetical protein GCM10010274_19790 [Streptomyces lavendofoliae]
MNKGIRMRLMSGAAAAFAAGALVLTASPAHATSSSTSVGIPGGNKISVNAWHCGFYVTACDWKASTKMSGTNPRKAKWIQNRAELRAHGVSVSITISKNPEATLTMKSRSMGEVRWKNTNANISDTHGQMRPGGATTYVSTKSCGSAKVTNSINISEKCAYAGAA